jgi:hypothetical protein
MNKNFQIYNYYTTCPNCSNFNTRINKALDLKYVLCYTCGLIFKPSNEEIKKILTPLDVQVGVHESLKNSHNEELDYLNKIKEKPAENNDYSILSNEIRNYTLSILESINSKNFAIISNNITEIKNDKNNITISPSTSAKEIEKNLYTKILKNGKIDNLIIENVQHVNIYAIFSYMQNAMNVDANIFTYIPIINNIYNNYYKYITDSDYIHNTYTLSHALSRINYSIVDFKRLNNFYVFKAKSGANINKNISEDLESIVNAEVRNILYSEPLFLVN